MKTKTLQLSDAAARKIYQTCAPEIKTLLEENFGTAFFSTELKDRINSWEDVCSETGNDPCSSLPFITPSNDDEEAANAHWRITQTIKLFKQGKKCNYAPGNAQYKHYAWLEYGKIPSGLGFSLTCTGYDGTGTFVGPRLSSLSEADARHIATVVCKKDYEKYYNE